ncbi:MAG: hypothetical protein V3R95_03440, partial [Dehalococcoidia bacterium]
MPVAVRDAAELLDVEMQQVAGDSVLVAHDPAGDAVQAVEAVEARAAEHRVDGGAGHPERPGDAVGAEAALASHRADALLQLWRAA